MSTTDSGAAANERTEFNYIDLARRLIPGETDESLEYILWEYTPFPFGGVLVTARHLVKWRKLRDAGMSECVECGRGFDDDGAGSAWCPDCLAIATEFPLPVAPG